MNVLLTFRSIPPLLSFFLLGIILSFSRGHYMPEAFWGLFLALVVYTVPALLNSSKIGLPLSSRSSSLLIISALFILAAVLALEPNIIYPQSKLLDSWFLGAVRLAAFLTGIFVLHLICRSPSGKASFRWLLILLAAFAYIRLFVLSVSPMPQIDVFAICSLGADYLLNGVNPYPQSYPDMYNGAYHNSLPPCLPYSPVYLCLIAPFRLLHDIRFACIVADGLTVMALWRIGSFLQWNIRTRTILIILWLVFPVSLFILEQSWVDPLLIAALTWSYVFLLENKIRTLGILLGLVCGIKLYGGLAAFMIVLHLWQTQGFKTAFRASCYAAAVLIVFHLPFAWLDAHALYQSTWTSLVSLAPRPDALTLWAMLLDQFDFPQPKSGTLIIAAVPICLIIWKTLRSTPSPANLTRSLVLAFTALFFFGSQAFCNYYYFLAFLIFLDLIFSLSPVSGKVKAPASTNLAV